MQTFLFNSQRTGASPHALGNKPEPEALGSCELPHWPKYAPESTAAIDEDGNLYFGCHDGLFYSLSPDLKIRWFFRTAKKIYSSPTLYNNRLYVAGGDGNLYCFNKDDGQLLWQQKFSKRKPDRFRGLKDWLKSNFVYPLLNKIARGHYHMADIGVVDCWASPGIDSKGNVYISGTGKGLHVYNAMTGEPVGSVDLGTPREHLAGVAIAPDDTVFVPSEQRYLYCIRNLQVLWRFDCGKDFDAWGCPSIDTQSNTVYCAWGRGHKQGRVCAVNVENGAERWRFDLKDGLRTTPVLQGADSLIVCSLSGTLYSLNRHSGAVNWHVRITNVPRAFWSSPCIDSTGRIVLSMKLSFTTGMVAAYSAEGKELWRYKTGKVLSTPLLDAAGRLYFGSSLGRIHVLQT